jgi:hypothetical protein
VGVLAMLFKQAFILPERILEGEAALYVRPFMLSEGMLMFFRR